MNLEQQLLLIKLMEECAEVIQAASKCIRFGYETEQPGYGVNKEVLKDEVEDVKKVINKMYVEYGALFN